MDPIIGGALIGGGFNLLGNLLGGSSAKSAQREANKANIQLNRENRDWMERMSNSEYQRGMADMKAAGLNPMLAFSQGGANTPNNSAAHVIPEDAMAKAITSAGSGAANTIAMMQGLANIDLTKANTAKTLEEAKTAGVTSSNAEARQGAELANIRAQYRVILEQEDLTRHQRQQIESLLPQLVEQQRLQMEAVKQQTSSARSEEKLTHAKLPAAEAEAKVWKELAGTGDMDMWLKLIIAIRGALR